jgi:hypothetical protein
MPGTLRPNEPRFDSGSTSPSWSMRWGPRVSVIPSEPASRPGSAGRRSGGRSSGRLPPRSEDRSRVAKSGWPVSAGPMWGQPSTWVTRSRSSRARVAPGSNRSSMTSVAPACMARMRAKLSPPTQNSGIGV